MKKSKMARWEAAILLGLLLAAGLIPLTAFAGRCGDVRENVLRLHILAASDSEEDQRLKLLVRDAILEQSGVLFSPVENLEEAKAILAPRLRQMEEIGEAVLRENGNDASIHAELVRMYFGVRKYGDVVLPAGNYDALRLVIGEGKGKNWWCVVFPPLCLSAARPEGSAAEKIEALQQPRYKVAFASLELLQQLWLRLQG